MHHNNLNYWQHTHTFGQERKRPGELRTIIVIVITGAMMVVEMATGILFGSMALLADGLHMASHAAALTINAFAYIYARRHAHDVQYSFGTGKVNALGGFTGAVLLAIFALLTAKYFGLIWMDPLMGIVGAILVSRWSLGLLYATSSVLLDKQGPEAIQSKIKENIEDDHDSRVADLHLWSVGPNIYSAIISIVTHTPKPPEHYRASIPSGLGLVHVTVEVIKYIEEDSEMATPL